MCSLEAVTTLGKNNREYMKSQLNLVETVRRFSRPGSVTNSIFQFCTGRELLSVFHADNIVQPPTRRVNLISSNGGIVSRL